VHGDFYQRLVTPETKVSCCNLADCPSDLRPQVGDHYEVKVNGQWTRSCLCKVVKVMPLTGLPRLRAAQLQRKPEPSTVSCCRRKLVRLPSPSDTWALFAGSTADGRKKTLCTSDGRPMPSCRVRRGRSASLLRWLLRAVSLITLFSRTQPSTAIGRSAAVMVCELTFRIETNTDKDPSHPSSACHIGFLVCLRRKHDPGQRETGEMAYAVTIETVAAPHPRRRARCVRAGEVPRAFRPALDRCGPSFVPIRACAPTATRLSLRPCLRRSDRIRSRLRVEVTRIF